MATWIKMEIDQRDGGGCGDGATSIAPGFCVGAKGESCINN